MNLRTYTIAAALLLMSCGNDNTAETIETDIAAKTLTVSRDNGDELTLNQGNKWKVDDHMLVHIRNMEQDIQAFSQQDNYPELAQKLQDNLNLLTSDCTMEGGAHDALHKWLLPYMETAEAYNDTMEDNEKTAWLEALRLSFVTFNRYFQ